MRERLRRLRASLSLRLAFYYGLLTSLTMLAAFAVLYMRTVGVAYQRMSTQVVTAANQLASAYAEGGADSVALKINHALSDGINSHAEVYLLSDPQGHVLAGNLQEEPVPDGLPLRQEVREVLRMGVPISAYVVSRRLDDGSLIVVGYDMREQQTLTALFNDAAKVTAIVVLVLLVGGTVIVRLELNRSISELRRIAARVGAGDLHQRVRAPRQDDEFGLLHRDFNDMLDRVLALMDGVRHVSDSIAHNLRTPLTRVMLQLRRTLDSAATAEDCRAAMATALHDLDELAQTFERLLRIAETEAGATRRRFESVALDAVADDVLEFYDAVAEAQGARLERAPAAAARVHGDPALLSSAVGNLVDNALKYGGPATRVRIGTQRHGQAVVLSVQDDGPGIDPAEYARVGTRFHRLRPDVPGHGLGLASVRAIVALHGGKIRFADARPGLRVEVELPAAPPPPP